MNPFANKKRPKVQRVLTNYSDSEDDDVRPVTIKPKTQVNKSSLHAQTIKFPKPKPQVLLAQNYSDSDDSMSDSESQQNPSIKIQKFSKKKNLEAIDRSKLLAEQQSREQEQQNRAGFYSQQDLQNLRSENKFRQQPKFDSSIKSTVGDAWSCFIFLEFFFLALSGLKFTPSE